MAARSEKISFPGSQGAALAARLGRNALLAVQALRQDARERRLSDASRAGEEVGVVEALFVERMAQRPHDVLLTDEAAEILRPPFARKYLIAHAFNEMGGEPDPRHSQRPAVAASFRT